MTLAGSTLQEGQGQLQHDRRHGQGRLRLFGSQRHAHVRTGREVKVDRISIVDDMEAEPVEEFFVVLGDPVNATITKNRGEGSIEASYCPDAPPTTDPTLPPPSPRSGSRPRCSCRA